MPGDPFILPQELCQQPEAARASAGRQKEGCLRGDGGHPVPGAEPVNAVPQPKAGSSFAAAAYRAFTDPVALDQACLDLVFNYVSSKDDDAKPLQDRINKKHGTHTVEYGEQIGLGTRKYTIVYIDKE